MSGSVNRENSTRSGFRRLRDVKTPGEVVILATSGLIKFRAGDSAGGRRLYLSAIETAEKLKRFDLRARASPFLALEEIKALSQHALDWEGLR
jgi:hypothetical protein